LFLYFTIEVVLFLYKKYESELCENEEIMKQKGGEREREERECVSLLLCFWRRLLMIKAEFESEFAFEIEFEIGVEIEIEVERCD
jgi:hypothetical protein